MVKLQVCLTGCQVGVQTVAPSGISWGVYLDSWMVLTGKGTVSVESRLRFCVGCCC